MAIAVPEQLATANLVGMPAVSGLVAFIAGSFAAAAVASNRFVSIGADSTIAPIMASAIAAIAAAGSPHYASLAGLMALIVGASLALAGWFRLGWIADLLSTPVTTGFLAGISIHIIVSQLPIVLGFEVPKAHVVGELAEIVARVGDTRLPTLVIGAGVLAAVILCERWNPRIPGALIGIAASGIAVWALGLGAHGVATLGALPIALPAPALEIPTLADLAQIFPVALVVALVCMMQTAAVAQSFPSEPGKPEDISRDFAALGVGSLLAALGGAFAVDSSPPRTAVVKEAGGSSQAVSLIAAALVALAATLASAAFAYVPQAALSGVLLFVGLRIFRVQAMRDIARRGGIEIALVVASAALVVLLPVPEGVGLSIVLSLLQGLYVVATPVCDEFLRVTGTAHWRPKPEAPDGERIPGVFVFGPGVPIYFNNARAICAGLAALLADRAEVKLVVLEGSGVLDLDFTGAASLGAAIAELKARGVSVVAAHLTAERARRAFLRSGLLQPEEIALSVEDAVRRWRSGVAGAQE